MNLQANCINQTLNLFFNTYALISSGTTGFHLTKIVVAKSYAVYLTGYTRMITNMNMIVFIMIVSILGRALTHANLSVDADDSYFVTLHAF